MARKLSFFDSIKDSAGRGVKSSRHFGEIKCEHLNLFAVPYDPYQFAVVNGGVITMTIAFFGTVIADLTAAATVHTLLPGCNVFQLIAKTTYSADVWNKARGSVLLRGATEINVLNTRIAANWTPASKLLS